MPVGVDCRREQCYNETNSLPRRFRILLCVICAVTPASAATQENLISQPQYVGANSITVSLSISDSGVATCTTRTVLKSRYTAVETIKLQRSSSESSWSTVATWVNSFSYSESATILSKKHSLSSGYYYRIQAIFNIYDSSGNLAEKITKATSSMYY